MENQEFTKECLIARLKHLDYCLMARGLFPIKQTLIDIEYDDYIHHYMPLNVYYRKNKDMMWNYTIHSFNDLGNQESDYIYKDLHDAQSAVAGVLRVLFANKIKEFQKELENGNRE